MSTVIPQVPREFVWRRLHSLTGLWLVLFLIEHLLTNSQAALLFGDNGRGFVRMVNGLHNLPYLEAVELTLLGIPFLIHMYWGVVYLFKAKPNSYPSDGSKPALPEYRRNKAYTWQRVTSWVLLVLIIFHVVKFRFIEYPVDVNLGTHSNYLVKIEEDRDLNMVAARLKVDLLRPTEWSEGVIALENSIQENSHKDLTISQAIMHEQEIAWLNGFKKFSLKPNQVLVAAPNFGLATLMSVRSAFKKPVYIAIYTIFVLAASFHAFNGFWTFLITWGALLSMKSQKSMVRVSIALILLISLLGLASIWGSYLVNLKT